MINLKLLQGIPNVRFLRDDVVGGGLPSKEALEEAKRQGIKTVVDLRTFMEGTPLMKSSVQKMGFKYYNIPIQGLNIKENQVSQLAEILSDLGNRPALIHCAVGGRVLALWEQYKTREQH